MTVYLISEIGYETYLVDFYEDLHIDGVEETIQNYFFTDISGLIDNFDIFLSKENDVLLKELDRILLKN